MQSDVELLESTTCALRAVAQKLAVEDDSIVSKTVSQDSSSGTVSPEMKFILTIGGTAFKQIYGLYWAFDIIDLTFQLGQTTQEDIQIVCDLVSNSSSSTVQANAIRIAATIGMVLAKNNPTHHLLKVGSLVGLQILLNKLKGRQPHCKEVCQVVIDSLIVY